MVRKRVEDTAWQVTIGAGALIAGYLLVRNLAGKGWEFAAERAEWLEGPEVNEAGEGLFSLTPTEWGARAGKWVRTEFGDAITDWSFDWSQESAMYDSAAERDPAGRDVGIGYR